MEAEAVRQYEGQEVRISLRNKYNYTIVIPKFEGTTFKATTLYGEQIEVTCDFIEFISPTKKEVNKNGELR